MFAEQPDVPLTVGFVDVAVSVMENAGSVSLKVKRDGNTQCKVQVHYYTEDKEAKAGEDYEPVQVCECMCICILYHIYIYIYICKS